MLKHNYIWEQMVEKNIKNDWSCDEIYLAKCVNESILKIHKLDRGWDKNWCAINRIDRAEWIYTENKLLEKQYIDCHSLRPYIDNKEKIDDLLEKIIKYYKI